MIYIDWNSFVKNVMILAMVELKKRKNRVLGLQEWIVFGVFVFVIGGSLFVQIATMINPDFFVRDKDNTAKIIESIRKNNPPKTKLPNSLSLDSYELQQNSYYSSEYPTSLEEPDRFSRVVTGKLTNNGDTIPAWALHLQFDIYDLDGKKNDGAYCIVWNDAEIKSGSTWVFKAFDNLDDCFPSISHSTKIDISKFVVVYRDYDIEGQ